jgi:hypothetical protein
MARTTTRKTGQFAAVGDDGRHYVVIKYTDYLDVSSGDTPGAMVAGMTALRTDAGHHVNHLGGGRYAIVETGVKLTAGGA